MTEKPDALLWIDTETTSIDPKRGDLLEIGVICTNMDATEQLACHHAVIHHETLTIDQSNLKALEYHLANGLLAQVFDESNPDHNMAAIDLCEFINTLAGQYTLHPAGTNIQFDLDWIREHLEIAGIKGLSHRRQDITSLRLALQTIGLDQYDPEEYATNHRTGRCLQRDIKEYQHDLKTLRKALK